MKKKKNSRCSYKHCIIYSPLCHDQVRILKHWFSIMIVLVLIPVVLPLSAVIALIIKIESPGPIFFKHRRVGQYGKPIEVIKFRTMYPDAITRLNRVLEGSPALAKQWHLYHKLNPDPRVTRIGRILRRLSLDELPQFINIIKGEMDIIGPRPVTPEEFEKYYRGFRSCYYVLSRPGLTGLWQVSGRSSLPYPKRVQMDIYYIRKWSIKLDLWILCKTLWTVISQKGAY